MIRKKSSAISYLLGDITTYKGPVEMMQHQIERRTKDLSFFCFRLSEMYCGYQIISKLSLMSFYQCIGITAVDIKYHWYVYFFGNVLIIKC